MKKLITAANSCALIGLLNLLVGAQCYAQKPNQKETKLNSKNFRCKPYAASQLEWKEGSEQQRAIFEQAYALQERHQLARAREKYEELASSFDNFALFFNLAICEADAGDTASAETHLKQSLRLNPGHRDAYEALSTVQEALGKHAEAKVSHDHFLKL